MVQLARSSGLEIENKEKKDGYREERKINVKIDFELIWKEARGVVKCWCVIFFSDLQDSVTTAGNQVGGRS